MIKSSPKVISVAALLMLASANPNANLAGSLERLPQAPAPDIAESADYNADYNKKALQSHNTYRRNHQVCDMKFSAEAAAAAQSWAEKMAQQGSMYHSSSSERPGCGENLAMHSDTKLLSTTNVATQMWYDEVTNPGYNFNNPGYHQNPGAGHFTQLVWIGSTELGCGISGVYVVCRYCNGPGNYLRQFESNVFRQGEAQCSGQEPSTPSSEAAEGDPDADDGVPEEDPESAKVDPPKPGPVTNSQCDIDESLNKEGANRCSHHDECHGERSCSSGGYCSGNSNCSDNKYDPNHKIVQEKRVCKQEYWIDGQHKKKLDAMKDYCLLLQTVDPSVVGYWWKAWGGGHGGCCSSFEELSDMWWDTTTYRLSAIEGVKPIEGPKHVVVKEKHYCPDKYWVGEYHKISDVDKCKSFCLLLQRETDDIVGYWWKPWGGGYCGCCNNVDDLSDKWYDTTTYSLPPVDDDIKYDNKFAKFEQEQAEFEAEETRLDEEYEKSEEELNERAKELAALFPPKVAQIQRGCCSACNRRRRSCGCRPARISVPTCQRCMGFCNSLTCNIENNTLICRTVSGADIRQLFKSSNRRRVLQETGESEECHQSLWENPDPSTETTAEKAMEAWYAQSIFFDYETGLPTPGKEKEAYEFLNVINTETTEVGFGIKENFVIGYYCPKANTDPESLKRTTPKERVPPTPPTPPEGVQLREGSSCPELDETGKRAACRDGLCCGMSSNSDASKTIDHCQAESTSIYDRDGENWTFECYDNATKFVMSLSAILVSFYLSNF